MSEAVHEGNAGVLKFKYRIITYGWIDEVLVAAPENDLAKP